LDTVQLLQQKLQSIEPAAHLVEQRVLRRVIRLDRNLQGLRLLTPHGFSYTIERDRLLTFVDLAELGAVPGSDLPRRLILLPRPEEDTSAVDNLDALLANYRRLLFHASVHLELESKAARQGWDDAWTMRRRLQLGDVEFSEIRDVLQKDDYLFPAAGDLEVYVEFAALYLELRYFAPHEARLFFPCIRDWEAVDAILAQDLNHAALYEQGRQLSRSAEISDSAAEDAVVPVQSLPSRSRTGISQLAFQNLLARAERVSATGNSVKAALLSLRAWRRAPASFEAQALHASRSELQKLVSRLQAVLDLADEEATAWFEVLQGLLAPAIDGFWTVEARLLYDLQKVCLEQERGVYRLDLVNWIRTLGHRPVRRPLPLMQEALTLRHLRTVRRRIAATRMTVEQRARLASLLDSVLPRLETRSRNRFRGILTDVFERVGLIPKNVPEQVARQKVIEELLDRVVERSYFSMSDLRDTLSKNDLKLPDVTRLRDVALGDSLLRADRRFEACLDGVYRAGAVYQRWPQTLSSLFFGTTVGRFLTQHLFIPFGGAYLAVVFLEHIWVWIAKGSAHPAGEHDAVNGHAAGTSGEIILGVVILGTWISLMLHQPGFRAKNLALLEQGWRALRSLLFDLPATVLHSEYVQQLLASRAFGILRDYVIEPGICLLLVWLPARALGYQWSGRVLLELYLAMALFLTSPVGRYTSELAIDFLVRAWQELKINIFSALIQAILDLFDNLMIWLERLVYSVDEFLRFRAGDNALMQAVKLAGGVVWFLVSYVVVFVFTLLLEPQINPIKHFPVVTVSHKVILPTGPILVRQLTPYLGKTEANTLVWTTIWLIPGVFGFLVWELKENWRLYAANRRSRLGVDPIGHHGESMLRLLRPGFHSGTLPKTFAALRREARKVKKVDANWLLRKWSAIVHVEDAVKHFVEREMLALLVQSGTPAAATWHVQTVRAATNRIDVQIGEIDRARRPVAQLTWEYEFGKLVGAFLPAPLISSLSIAEQEQVHVSVAGLFQRAGVEELESEIPLQIEPTYAWRSWLQYWSRLDLLPISDKDSDKDRASARYPPPPASFLLEEQTRAPEQELADPGVPDNIT